MQLAKLDLVFLKLYLFSKIFKNICINFIGIVIPNWIICLILLLIYSPLCWVRKIHRYSRFNFLSDCIFYFNFGVILVSTSINIFNGGISEDIKIFIHDSYLLFIGTSVYIFEGVRNVIPTRDICKSPSDYSKVLTLSMLIFTFIVIGFGLLNYLWYGDIILQQTQFITKALPENNIFFQSVLLLFMVHLFIQYPLTVNSVYSGIKVSFIKKWFKNTWRSIFILL